MNIEDFDFRLYDNKCKKYILDAFVGLYSPTKNSLKSILGRIGNLHTYDNDKLADLEVELYTGYKDKEGNKIFSGDILEFDSCGESIENYLPFPNGDLYRVVYDKGYLYLLDKHNNEYNNVLYPIDFKYFKIIKNIHDEDHI